MGIFILFVLSPWYQEIQEVPRARIVLQVLGGVLGVFGALASLIIWFGMAAFCLREDPSPVSTKIVWFVLFFVTAWFGSAVYFFRVYRKQVQAASTPSSP
jgi:hypothetical protein